MRTLLHHKSASIILVYILVTILALCQAQEEPKHDADEYGVDVSFPMQQDRVLTNNNPLGSAARHAVYQQFIEGCRKYYKNTESCNENERDRIAMNLQQPKLMQNFTSAGYAKVSLPKSLTNTLKQFFNDNLVLQQEEQWSRGSTYVNHWQNPTTMLNVENGKLHGGGKALKQKVVSFAQETLESWTKQRLVFTSLYGVRIYHQGAILAPHVDRLPLVTSAIINVAQDVDEAWPLELIGHDGKAHNVTMGPGEMILYESHSIIHGRPFPLKGRMFANIFVHFEPISFDYTEMGKRRQKLEENAERLFLEALERGVPETSATTSSSSKASLLPEYIQEGTEEEKMWRQLYAYQVPKEKLGGSGRNKKKSDDTSVDDSSSTKPQKPDAHEAAALGDMKRLKTIARENPELLLASDGNGWRPLHEAARAGRASAVEFLIRKGAKVNERTNNNKGGNPLWWARQYFEEDHPVIQVLRQNGAIAEAPEIEVRIF